MKRQGSKTLLLTAGSIVLTALTLAAAPQDGSATGQTEAPAAQVASGVPRLASFSGVVRDASGKLKTGVVTLTFSLYAGQEGGTPLWSETQDVQVDETGHYTVLIGATAPNGLPLDLFTTGTARWLGVQPALSGVGEQPRVLLVGMPYALKAADADTLGGKPASAFVMAESPSASGTGSSSGGPSASTSTSQIVPILGPSVSAVAPATAPTPAIATLCGIGVTSDGTAKAGQVAMFTTACNVEPSLLTQTGGNVGLRGVLQLPSMGTATKIMGSNSQPFDVLASAFNSSTNKAVSQHFRWQAEPVGNNSTAPSGRLNLLFASGTGTPVETGLSIASNGNVGIGTSPDQKLTVNGTVDLWNDNKTFFYVDSGLTFKGYVGPGLNSDLTLVSKRSGDWLRLGANSAPIGFWANGGADTDNSPQMVFTSAGYLGIGTTAPQYPLHVVRPCCIPVALFSGGDIRVSNGGLVADGSVSAFDVSASDCVLASGIQLGGTCVSDVRLKKNIQPFRAVLDKLVRLQPVSYNWRVEEYPQFRFGSSKTSGLIAQEVEKVFPDMVSVDEAGFKRVNYGELPYLMLQAIRELKAEKDKLAGQMKVKEARKDAQIRKLSRQVRELQKVQQRLVALEARLGRLEAGSGIAQARATAREVPNLGGGR